MHLLMLAVLVGAPGADDVAARLQQVYAATDDLKADFDQVFTYKVGGLERTSSGRVFLKKPGRMRFDYLLPTRRHFISDGASLWIYEPDEGQAFEDSLAGGSPAPVLALLLGAGDLTTGFERRLLDPGPGGRVRLELAPKASERHFRRAVLTLDPATYRVVAAEWEDPTGNVNRMTFKEMRTNVGLPDDGFRFVPPAGVRVVRAPGPAAADASSGAGAPAGGGDR